VNEIFASNLGLLILDEPTVHLDDANVQYLTEIFDELRKTVKNVNMQVIVVTHEPQLEGHFDTIIKLKGALAN
jgi:DNA repair exonuclease SbcCD ATPase subunit